MVKEEEQQQHHYPQSGVSYNAAIAVKNQVDTIPMEKIS